MIRKHLNQFGNYGQRLIQALFSPLVLFLVLAGNAVMFLCASLFFRLEAPVNPGLRHYGDALWLAMTSPPWDLGISCPIRASDGRFWQC